MSEPTGRPQNAAEAIAQFKDKMGIGDDTPLVTVRPPAEGALYHRDANPLVDGVLRALAGRDATVLLQRCEDRAGSTKAAANLLHVH